MKNEKVLLNIQTKWTDIANEILNAAIDAEQTFKCKWPYDMLGWSYSSTELFLSIWYGTAVSWNLINFQVTNQVSEIND